MTNLRAKLNAEEVDAMIREAADVQKTVQRKKTIARQFCMVCSFAWEYPPSRVMPFSAGFPVAQLGH